MKIQATFYDYDSECESIDRDDLIEQLEKEMTEEMIRDFNMKNTKFSVKFANLEWNDFDECWQLDGKVVFIFDSPEEELKRYFIELEKMSFNDVEVRFNNDVIETKDDCNPDWCDINCSYESFWGRSVEYKIVG